MPLRLLPQIVAYAALVGLPGALPALQVHASESPAPVTGSAAHGPMDRGVVGSSPVASPDTLRESRVFRLEDLPVHTSATGAESRPVTHGTLLTGESVGLHESIQPAGAEPVPLHVIHHSEFICVEQGELEFDHQGATGDVVADRVGAGGVIYVAEGTNHRVRNVGATAAKYFVVAIGGDAK